MPANEDLLDASVRHQIGLQRYSTATVRKIIALLNRIDPRLVEQISKLDPADGEGSWSKRRLEKLLDAVRGIITDAYRQVNSAVDDDVRALALYETKFQADLFRHTVPLALDIVTPSAAQLYAAVHARPFAGALLKDWYSGVEAGTQRRLADTIRMGYIEGRTTPQIVRDIIGTRAQRYADGMLEGSRRGVEAMVRTALNHTANVARNELYKANDGVIKGVRWVSTLDSRTCFVAGTPVLTPQGLVPIEKLSAGDIVIGGSRLPRSIAGVAQASRTRMARVTLSTGETVVCTVDHLFRTGDGIWQEAGDLSVGQKLASVL